MELKKIKLKDISNLNIFEVLHILSIDIAIGSLGGGILVSRILHVQPGFAFWIALPIAVLILYNLDHLIDGIKLKEKTHTIRHFFHYYYSKQIIAGMILLSLLLVPIIFLYLDKSIILFGISTAIVTGVYFIIVYLFGNRKLFFVQKELFVALIYSIGIWGGPASLMSYHFNFSQIILFCTFFICVFIAVVIYSYYEEDTDLIDNHTTLVSRYGILSIKYLLYFLFLVLFIISTSQIIYAQEIIYMRTAKLLMLMGIILLVILSYPKTLKQKNFYRYLVELVFWLPALSFWF